MVNLRQTRIRTSASLNIKQVPPLTVQDHLIKCFLSYTIKMIIKANLYIFCLIYSILQESKTPLPSFHSQSNPSLTSSNQFHWIEKFIYNATYSNSFLIDFQTLKRYMTLDYIHFSYFKFIKFYILLQSITCFYFICHFLLF